ncbi:hypothetical protein NPIL_347261 [Nephila pilipes]|uniref:Uncharacterized protein n=1 Tax=Nephila pilipes TaxID=299642 RepID=A0A8X6TWM7_NEPPI|nr:hypothetical protein NPIL_347261 [Nephila pilipes]
MIREVMSTSEIRVPSVTAFETDPLFCAVSSYQRRYIRIQEPSSLPKKRNEDDNQARIEFGQKFPLIKRSVNAGTEGTGGRWPRKYVMTTIPNLMAFRSR